MGVFLYFASVLIFLVFFKNESLINNKHTTKFVLILFILSLSVLFMFSINSFVYGDLKISDTSIYANNFYTHGTMSIKEMLDISDHESLFLVFSWIIYQIFPNHNIYFFIIWVVLNLLLLVFITKNIKYKNTLLFVYFSYILMPVFVPYLINGIRQGFAILLISLACTILYKDRKIPYFVILSLLAASFHVSSIPFAVIAYLLYKFNFSLKPLLVFWGVGAFLYITGLNSVFGSIVTKSLEVNTFNEYAAIETTAGNNNLNFLLLSLFILIYGMYYLKNYTSENMYIFKLFIVFNSLFLFFGYIGYANRISAYSWFFMPLLLWLPLKDYHFFNKAIVIAISIAMALIFTSYKYFTAF